MTTAQRREEILALLNQADAPMAAKDLAARFGVSRQVIVQDLAVIRASRPNEPNAVTLLRLCDTRAIPVATNIATAEVLIHGLERGDLAWIELQRGRK